MRSLARWGFLPLVAWPLGSWALGLGEIEPNSYLNQPLNAEIPLSATPEELASLDVAMAPVSVFTRSGLDYPAFLNSVRFTIGRNAAGANVIFVRSTETIAEPFVTLIVEVSTARASFNREFTVLLDPPLFFPNEVAAEPITVPATRPAEAAGGPIVRQPAPQPATVPAPSPAPVQQQPQPQPQPSQAQPQQQAAPPPSASAAGGDYDVQAGDTLWSIASRYRPAGVSMNQAMVSIYEANPGAFDGNINRLRRGAILRIPPAATQAQVAAAAANAEVRRQIDEWRAGLEPEARVTLLPPSEEALTTARAQSAADTAAVAELQGEVADLEGQLNQTQSNLAEARRLIEVQNEELAALREQLANVPEPAADVTAPVPDVEAAEPEPIFADEEVAAEPAEAVDETPVETAPVGAPTATPVPAAQDTGPSLVDRAIETVTNPIVLIAGAAVLVLIGALAFLRRRRDDVNDVTGQWEALEAELEDDIGHSETTRLRARAVSREPDMVVVEGHDGAETAEEPQLGATAEFAGMEDSGLAGAFEDGGTAEISALVMADEPSSAASRSRDSSLADQTLSSQTVINLDQADPIAEADFHMAYGLYDQAADLITKTLKTDPDNRELKLKLLEVYFVWGNKEQFLASAQSLKAELGAGSDWDKIVIMGKQICPDEALFSEATAAAGEVDLDLESSAASPGLDFAFEESDDDDVDLDFGIVDEDDMSLAATGTNQTIEMSGDSLSDDDMLEIGARTQAGLEAALFEEMDSAGERTEPGSDFEDHDITMESPTIESSAGDSDIFSSLTLENPTVESEAPDAPTVETPTIETPAAFRGGDTVEQPRPAASSGGTVEMTAEIELDDLGLDVGDLSDLSGEIAGLPDDISADDEMTVNQRGLGDDDDLLTATGVTQVLSPEDTGIELSSTAVLGDDDATMLAPGFSDLGSTGIGITTEVLEQPAGAFDPDPPATEDDLDLNLDDFSSALGGGADTVEQPMASSFGSIDLDVGADVPADDEPTGTEEVSPLDPQTMTEVGTKLDLARAYIDMGDPDGAKSILEEVLSEGDDGQRSEAQALIDALPA